MLVLCVILQKSLDTRGAAAVWVSRSVGLKDAREAHRKSEGSEQSNSKIPAGGLRWALRIPVFDHWMAF